MTDLVKKEAQDEKIVLCFQFLPCKQTNYYEPQPNAKAQLNPYE